MGGDRRSPPRHRNKGGGGVKSKGTTGGQGNCSGGGSKGVTSFNGALSVKTGSSVSKKNFPAKIGVGKQEYDLRSSRVMDSLEMNADMKEVTENHNCIENRHVLDQELDNSNSFVEGKLNLVTTMVLKGGENNSDLLANNATRDNEGVDLDQLPLEYDGMQRVMPVDCVGKPDLDSPAVFESGDGAFNVVEQCFDPMNCVNSVRIPGMVFSSHNPMFWDDNSQLNGDGAMSMDDIMNEAKNGDGLEKVQDVQNSSKGEGLHDSLRSDSMRCNADVCVIDSEANQFPISGSAGDIANDREANNQGRGYSGRAGPARQTKEVHYAWKRPDHIQVEWKFNGKATEDGRFVSLNMEAVNQNQMKLERALVGKLIGRRLPYNILESELKKRWDPYGEFKFLMIGDDSFTCIFQSVEARDAVLMGGPWLIGGYIMGLDKWSPTFSQDSMCGLSAPIWIRFPKLPLLYWDNDNLARIASMIGQPLWIDAQTSLQGRCAYARICVRLDLAKKLPTGVWIPGIEGNFLQPVEYEGLYQVCFACGHIGHTVDNCGVYKGGRKEKLVDNARNWVSDKGVAERGQDKSPFGWRTNGTNVGGNSGIRKPFREESGQADLAGCRFEVGQSSKSGMIAPDQRDFLKHAASVPSFKSQQVGGEEVLNGIGNSEDNRHDMEDDSHYGPWIFVARRKGRFSNQRGKNSALSKGNQSKQNLEKATVRSKEASREVVAAGRNFKESSLMVFTAGGKNCVSGDGLVPPDSLRLNAVIGRNGSTVVDKQVGVNQQDPFWSRKKRKADANAEADGHHLIDESNGGVFGEEDNPNLCITNEMICGGDVSPLVD